MGCGASAHNIDATDQRGGAPAESAWCAHAATPIPRSGAAGESAERAEASTTPRPASAADTRSTAEERAECAECTEEVWTICVSSLAGQELAKINDVTAEWTCEQLIEALDTRAPVQPGFEYRLVHGEQPLERGTKVGTLAREPRSVNAPGIVHLVAVKAACLVVDDDDTGPWVKILEYGTEPYTPTSSAVGTLIPGKKPTEFAKLSDDRINELAGGEYYLRCISSNTETHLYAHIRGLRFADDKFAFGFADSEKGLKVQKSFAEGSFVYAGHQNATLGIDTLVWQGSRGVTGDDEQRWWVDSDRGCSSGWAYARRKGVRTFNQGASTRWANRTHVSIWVKPAAPSAQV